MSSIEGIRCDWCEEITPVPKYTNEESSILHLSRYPMNKGGLDFCDRLCMRSYLDDHGDVGAIK